MCGIAGGMSSTLSQGELHKIKGLMMMSCFRGMFGSGSMVVTPGTGKHKHLQVLTHKTELCAAELTCDEDFLDNISRSPKIVVTHARAPTKGSNELQFVHPHRAKHITGVHNGTMHRVMDKLVGDNESDSAAIIAAISEHGVEQFIKESRGAYSLVWVDVKEGSLNFLRNDMRPMVFANIGFNDTSTMYWSSELGQLKFVLEREGLKDARFESPKAFQHVKFPLGVQHKIVPMDIKQYSDPVVVSYTGWNRAEWEEYTDAENVTPLARRIQESRSSVPSIYRAPMGGTHMGPRSVHSLPMVETILLRRSAPSAHFPSGATGETSRNLLRAGSCVVCDNTPVVIQNGNTQIYPIVHEVKFGSGFKQYICDECVRNENPIALAVLDIPAKSATRH